MARSPLRTRAGRGASSGRQRIRQSLWFKGVLNFYYDLVLTSSVHPADTIVRVRGLCFSGAGG